MLEAMERGIQRALLDAQQFVGNLLDSLRDGPAMHRLEGERSHDQQVEGALQDVGLVAHAASLVDCPRETERVGEKFNGNLRILGFEEFRIEGDGAATSD